MLIFAAILFFLTMLTAVGAVGYAVFARQGAVSAAAAPAPATPSWEQPDTSDLSPWLQLLSDLGTILPADPKERQIVRRQLATAGYRADWADEVYFGARVLTTTFTPILFAILAYNINPDPVILLPALFAGYIGYTLPERHVRKKIEARKKKINRGLPDFLDLLVIAVESGLSLEQAMADTARDLQVAHPEISDELSVFRLEVMGGASRAEALANLAKRTREPEMRKLTSLLIQADRFGSSISKVLRTQARYMRIRRRQRAEEMAHKVGVKLIFPIFFLIMPSMFLVTAGPAVIMLLGNFSRLAAGE